jgi:hypothetical protein
MKKDLIKKDYQVAVDNTLKGQTTGRDLINIVKFQNRDLGEIHDINAATLVLYQATFN